ncbi:hypothetical protein STVA_25520 [Allostella vacuolata]|nr:hypothetical protein STVA_25520 [Stella vacuolata]
MPHHPPGFAADPVPAVRESEATGEVAAIFAEIRAVQGLPIVNLVWRHLATMPDALAWTWTALLPLYRSGAVAGAIPGLQAGMALPEVPRWPAAAFRAVGIDATEEPRIAAVLDSYDRGNTMNLLAFHTLLARLDGHEATPATASATGSVMAIGGQLPPLLDLGGMAPATAELVLALNRLGQGGGDGPILASLYRHLAHWPAYMALAWTLLQPIERRGELAVAIASTRAAAAAQARSLLAGLDGTIARPSPAAEAFVRAGLGLFVGHGIARMTTIGRLLLAAGPAADQGC